VACQHFPLPLVPLLWHPSRLLRRGLCAHCLGTALACRVCCLPLALSLARSRRPRRARARLCRARRRPFFAVPFLCGRPGRCALLGARLLPLLPSGGRPRRCARSFGLAVSRLALSPVRAPPVLAVLPLAATRPAVLFLGRARDLSRCPRVHPCHAPAFPRLAAAVPPPGVPPVVPRLAPLPGCWRVVVACSSALCFCVDPLNGGALPAPTAPPPLALPPHPAGRPSSSSLPRTAFRPCSPSPLLPHRARCFCPLPASVAAAAPCRPLRLFARLPLRPPAPACPCVPCSLLAPPLLPPAGPVACPLVCCSRTSALASLTLPGLGRLGRGLRGRGTLSPARRSLPAVAAPPRTIFSSLATLAAAPAGRIALFRVSPRPRCSARWRRCSVGGAPAAFSRPPLPHHWLSAPVPLVAAVSLCPGSALSRLARWPLCSRPPHALGLPAFGAGLPSRRPLAHSLRLRPARFVAAALAFARLAPRPRPGSAPFVPLAAARPSSRFGHSP